MGVLLAAALLIAAQDAAAPPVSVNHLSLPVIDAARSGEFYMRVFGLERMPNRVANVRWLRAGAFELHLVPARDGKIPATAREQHLAFRTPDMAAFTKRLVSLGIKWTNNREEAGKITTRADGVLQIYLRDPDGYWVEVQALAPR